MNAAWATSLDHLWRSATLPMWLALAAATFFALIVLVTLLRAEKSVANGALTVITLLAIGVAAAATLRGSDTPVKTVAPPAGTSIAAAQPALSCMDELAGEMVLSACEKSLFSAPDSVAAAVSGTAVQLDRLLAFGDVATANKAMTPDLARLRRSVERDRYGLIAYLLQSRDHCMPDACPAYASLTDSKQIASHMEERLYEGLVTRYAPSWNVPATASPGAAPLVPGAAAAAAAVAGLPASVPTGKPTNADFPSSSSIPAVSIMTDTPAPAPKPPAAPRAAAKKQAAPHHPQAAAPAAPVPLAPAPAQADN